MKVDADSRHSMFRASGDVGWVSNFDAADDRRTGLTRACTGKGNVRGKWQRGASTLYVALNERRSKAPRKTAPGVAFGMKARCHTTVVTPFVMVAPASVFRTGIGSSGATFEVLINARDGTVRDGSSSGCAPAGSLPGRPHSGRGGDDPFRESGGMRSDWPPNAASSCMTSHNKGPHR